MGTDDELEEAQVDTRVEIVSEKKKSSLLIVDPFGHVYHYWLLIVSLAVVYNLYLIIGRAVFWQLENVNPTLWFVLDYVCDGIYVLDIIVHIMTGKIYRFEVHFVIDAIIRFSVDINV